MNRAELEHAIRAACEVANDTELYIFGSQAILGQHPHPPESLTASVEVDVQPKNSPEATDLIDGALGEDSMFHETYGFYVHGVSVEAAHLPEGWQRRAIAVRSEAGTRGNTGWCLESHDLAASKLSAFRDKDREFVTTLLGEGLIDADILTERIRTLPVPQEHRETLTRWVAITASALAADEGR